MLEQSSLLQFGRQIDELRREIEKLRDSITTRVKPLLTVGEVAELTGRAPYTVRHWIKDGLIKAERVQGTGPRGRLLVPREQVERIVDLGRGPSGTGPGFGDPVAACRRAGATHTADPFGDHSHQR